jgi:hypothetical protein
MKLTASVGKECGYFGDQLSISGNILVVGGYYCSYIFEKNAHSNSWAQTAKLTADDGASEGAFERGVDIYGDISSLVLVFITVILVLHTFIQDKMVETGHRQPRLLLVTEQNKINSDILSLHQKILWSWVLMILIHLQTLFISLKRMLVVAIGMRQESFLLTNIQKQCPFQKMFLQ